MLVERTKDSTVRLMVTFLNGATRLFEHQGKPFSRISVTNRIKHEPLRTIGKEVTAQQLRHTWAAIQIQRGIDIRAVAAELGHARPGVTSPGNAGVRLAPEETFLDLEEKKQAANRGAAV